MDTEELESFDMSSEDMDLLAEVIDMRVEKQMRERDTELLEMQASMNKIMSTVKKLSVASEHAALSRTRPIGKDTSRHNRLKPHRANPRNTGRKHTGHMNNIPRVVQISQECQYIGQE